MAQGQILTYPLLGLSVFARQLCLPIPAVLVLISAGTLVRESKLNLILVLLMSVAGAVAGDAAWYEAGRYWGSHILRILTSFSDDPKALSARARGIFRKYGLATLLIAKFIPGLDGITPPLAGLEGTGRLTFFLFDAGGSFLWAGVYVVLGLCFARQVDRILIFLEASERILLLLVGVPLVFYTGRRVFVVLRMFGRLRTRYISPTLLHKRLKDGLERVLVIDLLGYMESPDQTHGVPGAVRIDPSRLRSKTTIRYPAGLSFVLYTSNSSLFRCARVALSLKARGIEDVWILEGGLRNWTDAGLPTSSQLLNEDEAMSQYGLQIESKHTGTQAGLPALEVLSEGGHS